MMIKVYKSYKLKSVNEHCTSGVLAQVNMTRLSDILYGTAGDTDIKPQSRQTHYTIL